MEWFHIQWKLDGEYLGNAINHDGIPRWGVTFRSRPRFDSKVY